MKQTIDNKPIGLQVQPQMPSQARPGKQKLLQPLSASLDPVSLRQMMASWKTAGLSYTQMFKMLKLYLGETAWMDRKGEYPRANFFQMSKGLKFQSITVFLKCLSHCAGFGFVWSGQEGVEDNLVAVFSQLWHQPAKGEKVTYSAGMPAEAKMGDATLDSRESSTDNNNIYINNYNNNINNNIQCSTLESGEQALTDFLLYLSSESGAYEAIVKPINEQTERMMPELHVERAGEERPVNPATQLFLRKYLGEYLKSRGRRFVHNTNEGRKIWTLNLLSKYDFMQQNIVRAVSDLRTQYAANILDLTRQHRPISPHEYQDCKSGQRLYDLLDAEGQAQVQRIPQEAPPRPSEDAIWDKFAHQWRENL